MCVSLSGDLNQPQKQHHHKIVRVDQSFFWYLNIVCSLCKELYEEQKMKKNLSLKLGLKLKGSREIHISNIKCFTHLI